MSLATSFSPLAALVIAMLLLGEDPGAGIIPGGIIILAAIAVGQYGRIRSNRAEALEAEAARMAEDDDLGVQEALDQESKLNFKGA